MPEKLYLLFQHPVNITHHFFHFTLFQSVVDFFYFAFFIYQCKELGVQKIVLNRSQVVFGIVNMVTLPGLVIQAILFTGKKDSLYYQARQSYHIDDPKNNLTSIEDDFLHTQFFALVNKKGEVKKIYDGLKQSEVEEMMSDIDRMLKE